MKTYTKFTCTRCGKKFGRLSSEIRDTGKFFCSRVCFNEYRHIPENNPSWNGGKIEMQCVVCGEIFLIKKHDVERRKTCCMECRNIYISEWQKKYCWLINLPSELHPNWNGGSSYEEYPKRFYEIRNKIKEKYDYKCVECDNTEDLCVHHIDYDKKNNNTENLIVLCRCCHAKTNFSRDKWKNRYEKYAL